MIVPPDNGGYLNSIPEHCKKTLPKIWNSKDKSPCLALASDDLTVSFKAEMLVGADTTGASVRADHPVPKHLAFFYYEVTVMDDGVDGAITIGLMNKESSIQYHPGHDKECYGYNAGDGTLCDCGLKRKSYGPSYYGDDVIGVCLNRLQSTLFFTKNGVKLGTACASVSDAVPFFPAVGLHSNNGKLRANFGASPFMFDIDDFVMSEQQRIAKVMFTKPWPLALNIFNYWGLVDPSKVHLNPRQEVRNRGRQRMVGQLGVIDEMKRVIHGYALHHGYARTAQSIAHDLGLPDAIDTYRADSNANCHLITRKEVLGLIMAGRVGAAIDLVRRKYPSIFEEECVIFYHMCVQSFIESVVGVDPAYGDNQYIDEIFEIDTCADVSTTSRSPDAMDVEMSAEECQGVDYSRTGRPEDWQETAEQGDVQMGNAEQNGWDHPTSDRTGRDALERSLVLANKISKAADSTFEGNELAKHKEILMEIFSMVAYEKDLLGQRFKEILGITRRVELGVKVNNAILDLFDRQPKPALEQLIGHLHLITSKIIDHQEGHGGMVNVNQWL